MQTKVFRIRYYGKQPKAIETVLALEKLRLRKTGKRWARSNIKLNIAVIQLLL